MLIIHVSENALYAISLLCHHKAYCFDTTCATITSVCSV